jgi:DNA-binding NarL/FixJ family response regulator
VIDGIYATAEIKRLNGNIKIIIVSMLGDLPAVAKAMAAGADAFILKSDGASDLKNAIKAVFRNEVYVSPSIRHYFDPHATGKPAAREDLVRFAENLITEREKAVLKLIAEGYTNQRIADTLFISVKTADTHRKNLLAKLGLPNTAALVRFAVENKLV